MADITKVFLVQLCENLENHLSRRPNCIKQIAKVINQSLQQTNITDFEIVTGVDQKTDDVTMKIKSNVKPGKKKHKMTHW